MTRRHSAGTNGRPASGAARRRAPGTGRSLTVLKVGGSLLEASETDDSALDQAAAAWRAGEEILLVHGGGNELSRWLERLGLESRFVDGQRVTTPEALQVAIMVLGGLVNRRLVEGLVRRGCPAVGLTGADGAGTLAAPVIDRSLGAVGEVVSVNAPFFRDLLAARRVPVVASLSWSPAHGFLNVNADLMAAALAAGLGARRLLLMTEVAGVQGGDGTTIPRVTLRDIARLLREGTAHDGMIPKLRACRAALEAQVPEVMILGPSGGVLDRVLRGTAPGEGTRVVWAAP
ncbi:MAG TPA: acetylglutamate kinase [Candidatus Polarisedimenticolia bacterium]|nr:acetylglutamate kinase [Candidatus Polarisedimenticolia bacterium]